MTISIARGRQFTPGTTEPEPLYDATGALATWLPKAAEKLVAQNIQVRLVDTAGAETKLTTQAEWNSFLQQELGAVDKHAAFGMRFRVAFSDFVEMLDDAAASTDSNLLLDMAPTSALSQAVSLDTIDGDYALKLIQGAKVAIDGLAGAPAQEAVAAGVNEIGPEILSTAISGGWERDRSEQESWADYRLTPDAMGTFRQNTGPAPFLKLTEPKWNDDEAMALASRFELPLHLELSPGGQPQDNNEMFRETYFDDRQGTLASQKTSVRARVRFDDDPPYAQRRALLQAKEGRDVDPISGQSQVHKFEKRWEGAPVTEAQAQAALVTGKDTNGSVLSVSQKLYKLMADANALPADGKLRLEPQRLVLQRRRRTHLQLDSVSAVQSRRTALQAEITAAGANVDPRMTTWLAKLDKQISTMTEMGALLQKYGKFMPSGECFIVSADRYNIYDPAARMTPPVDIDDEAGLVGRGPPHIELEWDTQSSDPFENAFEEMETRLSQSPPNAAEIQADKVKLTEFKALFEKDRGSARELLDERLISAGLQRETRMMSKDEWAQLAMVENKSRALYWV